MLIEDQSEVIAFLSRPAAYGETVSRVERCETHASIIFLTDSTAYKLKRAVRFPYLDYSSADLRRRFCEAEVQVNRRTAPDLYRGVVAVVREGRRVWSWAAAARRWTGWSRCNASRRTRCSRAWRMPAGSTASLWRIWPTPSPAFMAMRNRISTGGAAGLARVLDSNRSCFADGDPRILDRERTACLVGLAKDAFNDVAPLLDRRRDEGRVRHCHGDLHLRNIIVHNGHAVLFDAIEFDPAFAEIDVLYDLAFVAMDLEFRGLRRLASILLNRYLDNTGDVAGLPALPLFLSTRAAIRAHVDAFSATSQSDPGEAAELAAPPAVTWSWRSPSCVPEPPRLIAIGGLSGSGKSKLRANLHPCGPAPWARVARTDSTRKRLAGVALATRLGPRDYSSEMSRRPTRRFMTKRGWRSPPAVR